MRIYTIKQKLVSTHDRAQSPGERMTHLDHLPPEKVPGLTLNREECVEKAAEIGPMTLQVVHALLDDPVLDRLPTAGRVLRLYEKFGDERLEAACQRAIYFDDPAYKTIKRILKLGLENEPFPVRVSSPEVSLFVRSADELVGDLLENAPWN